jgi:hypothetical protein
MKNTMNRKSVVFLAILGGITAGVVLHSIPMASRVVDMNVALAATTTPGATPTDWDYHALTTSQLAIDEALLVFPDKTPTAIVAKLKTRYDALVWRKGGATPIPGNYNSTSMAEPAWIVGIQGTGVTNCDITSLDVTIGHYGRACDPNTTLFGLYYVLSPSDAMLLGAGEMTSAMYSTLSAMSNDSPTITFNTPAPLTGATLAATQPWGPPQIVTSTPEPTSTP